MKKILFAALAAAFLATGCQKTEIINPVGDAIGFNAALNKLTKGAADAGEANLQSQNFKVWSYYAYTDETNGVTASTVYDGINGMDVTYTAGADGAAGSWGTELQYYWPGTGKSLDFFAVSTGKFADETKPSVTIEGMGAGKLGTRKLTITGYTVNNANANDDLMVAEFVRQNQEQNQKVVDLKFKHALSKVIFKFKTNSTDATAPIVNVKSLTIKDVATSGTLTVTEGTETLENNSDDTRVDVVLAWTSVDTPSDITETFTTNNTLTTSAETYVTKLLMPQALTDKKLSIVYTITENKDGASPREFDIDFNLGEATVNSWGINQAITYVINLSPNTIKFNPSVAPWETVTDDTSMSN